MADILVSVAEFKARLSQILTESRTFGRTIVITSRKKPIATVVPYTEQGVPVKPGEAGLASLAGTWDALEEIHDDIDSAYRSRQEDPYREVSL